MRLKFLAAAAFAAVISLTTAFGQSDEPVCSPVKKAELKATLDLTAPQSDFHPNLATIGIYHDPDEMAQEKRPKVIPEIQNYQEDGNSSVLGKTESVESPSVFLSYNGYADAQYTPPDNSVAVSDNGYVFSAMNCNYRIFDPSGKLVKYSSFYDLFRTQYPSLKGPLFDPRVIFDPEAKKFIAVTLYQHQSDSSKIMIMFSKTDNPLDGWNLYSLPGDVLQKGEWTDYPNIAVSYDELFITGNLFDNNTSFIEPMILQIDKEAGYSGGTLNYQVWSNLKDASGGYGFTLVPAGAGLEGAAQEGMYLVSNLLSGGNYLNTYHITNKMGQADTKLVRFGIVVPFNYYSPYTSAQKGSTLLLNSGDCRIKSAFILDNTIHYVFATQNSNNNAAIAYGRYNVDTHAYDYKVLGQSGYNYTYPSLASMALDNTGKSVIIGFERCGPNSYADMDAVFCDDNLNFSSSVVIQPGVSPIGNISGTTVQRWGDYSTIARQPNTANCVMSGCYATSGNWNTRIAVIGLASLKAGINTSAAAEANLNVYPNPVMSNMNVTFNLRKNGPLNISVYDLQGREIEILYNGVEPEGRKMFEFNQDALPSGTYLLRVTSGGQDIVTKKIVRE